ncbi:MAG TPA: serine protease [Verrucomicrobiae bacterium]|nr:serine protease [Verrucomicrobiae bacterium]
MASSVPISVEARILLDAAGPKQRKTLNAIYLIACPGVGFGSGFLIDSGVIVTNAHVVGPCNERNLLGINVANEHIGFSHLVIDGQRDLALLVPDRELGKGFRMASVDRPEPGMTVSTWGYPFGYAGLSPLLSVGYLSGYRDETAKGVSVKHLVVNGAFNHGNSGGPLLIARTNKVVGVVVSTFNFYPPSVPQLIGFLSSQPSGFMVAKVHYSDGSERELSEAQVTGRVLGEFYQKTQVMIGEAVAASEVRALIREHKNELPQRTMADKHR